MNRTVKAALAIVCAGALLAGVGAGVAFGEYSSLRYEELPISGFDQAITASETVEVGEEGDVFVSTWLQYVLTWGFVGTKNPDRRSGLWSS